VGRLHWFEHIYERWKPMKRLVKVVIKAIGLNNETMATFIKTVCEIILMHRLWQEWILAEPLLNQSFRKFNPISNQIQLRSTILNQKQTESRYYRKLISIWWFYKCDKMVLWMVNDHKFEWSVRIQNKKNCLIWVHVMTWTYRQDCYDES